MKVYLCEKPSQAKDLAVHVGARQRADGCISGDGVAVTWCIGHLLEQAQPEAYGQEFARWDLNVLPILPSPWQLEVKSQVKSQYKIVEGLLRRASEVIIATDADREGEVIAREVMERVGYRGRISRLWLSAMDSASVRKALGKMLSEQDTRSLYQSGLGRSRADWLMGMNITRGLTTAFGAGGPGSVLHCGRVQTPVLGLIVRRERAIANFKPKSHFVLEAAFEIMGTVIPMDWVAPEGVLDADGHCISKAVIESVASKVSRKAGRVISLEAKPEREQAPLPYYLGSLQKEANRRFGLKAQQVLDICQALYEKHKATTYPRTDCEYLPSSMWADVPATLQALGHVDASLKPLIGLAQLEKPTRCFNDSKVTAHHAIIPTTNASVQLSAMSPHERTVYELIRRRYIAQFLGDHLYTKTTIGVQCEGERFTKTGKATTSPGWKRAELPPVQAKDGKVVSADDAAVTLPNCSIGNQALNVHANCAAKKTEPPKRYNEASLISAMESIDKEIDDPRMKAVMKSKEKAGIGTDATRSAIIEGLFKREYISNEKKSIVPTTRGTQLIELMEKITPQLVDPVLTAHWEDQLSEVEAGRLKLEQFEASISNWLVSVLDAIKAKAGTTQIQAGAKAQAKANTQSVKQTGAKPSGSALAGLKCPSCGQGVMRQRNGLRGPFWGCSAYPNCKHVMDDQDGQPIEKRQGSQKPVSDQNLAGQTCPTCNAGKLELRNLKDSEKQFWGCSKFQDGCRHFVWAK